MTHLHRLTVIVLAAGLTTAALQAGTPASRPPTQPARMLALTFEGLPFVDARADGDILLSNAQIGTTEILRVLAAHGAPAIGFVSEARLDSAEREGRTALLQAWVDAGATLGNGTWASADLNTLTAEAFQEQIAKGDVVGRRLMQPRTPYTLFFRHPYAHTGDTQAKKDAVEAFLAARDYRIAPYTIESRDDLFNAQYAAAVDTEDPTLMARLLAVYTDFVMRATEFAEQTARQIFKRDIPQILRLHANDVNSDALHEILTRLEARGYRIVTLEAAMADTAYATKDTLVTSEGPSWLSRWAQTLGVTLGVRDAPAPPQWILDLDGRK